MTHTQVQHLQAQKSPELIKREASDSFEKGINGDDKSLIYRAKLYFLKMLYL